MNASATNFTETDLANYIARGATRLTPSAVQQLVTELPDLREQFSRLRASPYPEAERQLCFLAEVVDRVWTDAHREMPYAAALEAAFAITYFFRDVDLIPDSLGEVGLIDDIAIIQAVFARNARAYEAFREATKLDWANFKLSPRT